LNIALPALIIVLGILPGIAFYYAYFAGRFEKRRVGASTLEELCLYVVLAIPINAFFFWILRQAAIDLDVDAVVHLLAGSIPDDELDRISQQLQSYVGLTVVAYLVVLASSVLGGVGLRAIVWRYRIDTVLPVFRWRHPWYYFFQGRQKHLPSSVVSYVDILAEHAEDKTRLYRGAVVDYDMAADGKLESICLRGAKRGKGRGDQFKWEDIPSDYFMIMGCKIHSINVTYYEVEEVPDGDEVAVEPPAAQPPASPPVTDSR
jgi:hypothetical protein